MTRIHILPEHEARKIAAGEVVERPASVVKELLENAVDAQATEITITLLDGGKASIIVSDNGCGMSPDDARLCVEHHATSKIRSVDELTSIQTFGFRGEALSSIASVSTVHIVTRRPEDQEGYGLHLVAGTITQDGPAPANVGTRITVGDLFFNVPARRKFLKQRDTEWRAIQQLVMAYALALPRIGFTLTHDGNTTLSLAPCDTMFQRAQQLFAREGAEHLLELPQRQYGEITVTGVISTHKLTRYDRRYMMSFINQRWVKNHIIGKAILNGYQHILPQGKYPYAALALTIPLQQVDINIHPRKEEVLLLHPHIVTDAIEASVNRALNESTSKPIMHLHHVEKMNERLAGQPFTMPARMPYMQHISHAAARDQDTYKTSSNTVPEQVIIPTQKDTVALLSESPEQSMPLTPSYQFIGVLGTTYLLIETIDGLLMIDQHAAHERVIFDQLEATNHIPEPTELLFPEFITLSNEDYHTGITLIPHFVRLGIRVEPWGGSQLMVTATTAPLKHITAADIIAQCISSAQNATNSSDEATFYREARAMIACKAAVKAGDILSISEIDALIVSYLKTPHRMTCPHGRPTSWFISYTQIERTFKRT